MSASIIAWWLSGQWIIPPVNVAASIGVTFSPTTHTNDHTSGEIGASIAGAVKTKQVMRASIGTSFSEVVAILHQSVAGNIGVSVRAKEVTNLLTSGEIGSRATGVIRTNQRTSGTIGASIRQKNVVSQAVEAMIGLSESEKTRTNQVVSGKVGVSSLGIGYKVAGASIKVKLDTP